MGLANRITGSGSTALLAAIAVAGGVLALGVVVGVVADARQQPVPGIALVGQATAADQPFDYFPAHFPNRGTGTRDDEGNEMPAPTF